MSVYSTKSNSNTAVSPYRGNVLDLVVENAENDLKMFDSVITFDFLEAYNDAGYSVVTEADEENAKTGGIKAIAEKIYTAFMKAIETVSGFIDKWVAKITNTFANDAKTYKKYQSTFNDNAVGYVTKYTPMENFNSVEGKLNSYPGELDKKYKDAINKIAAAATAEDANAALKEYKDALSTSDVSTYARGLVFPGEGKEVKEYEITNKDRGVINTMMSNPKSAINWATDLKKRTQNTYTNNAKAERKNLLDAAKEGKDALARANAMNSATSAYISASMKYCSSVVNVANQALMQARRVFLGASHVKKEEATGAASEETKNECALIEMASDIYMESALAMD